MGTYEAWDTQNDVCIYNGGHKSDLIVEITDYIEYQNHIDENLIHDDQIKKLDDKALKKVGITIFINT